MLQIYFSLHLDANKYTRFEKIWSLLVVLVNNYHGFVCQRLWRAFWLLKVQNFPFYNCGGCLRLRAIFLRNFCFFGEKIDTRCGWGRLAWWRGVGVFGVGRGDFVGADFVGFLAVGVAVKCGWPGGRGAAILRASKLRMIASN